MQFEKQVNITSVQRIEKKQKHVARVITISSGKGGVGKSSIAVNLAVELSLQKHKVCIFDADTNLANINIMTGIQPVYTLYDLLKGDRLLSEIILKGPAGIHIIPAASGMVDFVGFGHSRQNKLINLLKQLESEFDFILIDTAAGIDQTVLSFVQAAAETIITITPEPTSLTDAFSLLKVLQQKGFDRPVQVLVNKVQSYQVAKEVLSRFSRAVKKYLGLSIVAPGYVLEDRNVARSIMLQKPISVAYPQSRASLCIRNFSHKLLHKTDVKSNSLVDYFSMQLSRYDEISAAGLPFDNLPWMGDLVEIIENKSFEEAEQLMAFISTCWLNRLDQKQDNLQYLNSSGFKAAIRFASKLKKTAIQS